MVRSLLLSKPSSLVDNARVFALVNMAASDAFVAVFDAKYAHNFWRPITAIRNGDTDDNPATERDATWQPIDNTPMHPEYPCAHCIVAAAVSTVLQGVAGNEIGEITLASPTDRKSVG